MKREFLIAIITITGLGFSYCLTQAKSASAESKKVLLRVGTYDSRAVAVAYYNSDFHDKLLKEKMRERDTAEAEGDTAKVKELEEWGSQMQSQAHLQGFGKTSVVNCLEFVKDKLPEIANDAGVDIIVSKWSLDYQSSEADFVDITDELVKLYNPDKKVLKWIDQLRTKEPVDEATIKSHKH